MKSKKHNLQKLATVVAAKDDVALLKVDSDFPDAMCALGLMANDVYGTQAIRFGIPGGWDEPGPSVGVRIDQQGGQFTPLILLAPAIVEKGESGGPVIYLFHVVGITRARHVQYPAFSFMTVGSTIRSLMATNSVRSGKICNPVETSMWASFNSSGIEGLKGNVFASIKLDNQIFTQTSAAGWEALSYEIKKFGRNDVTVKPGSAVSNDVLIQGNFGSVQEHSDVVVKADRATKDISQQIQETLWRNYVEEGEKTGKWKDAIIPPASVTPSNAYLPRQ